MVAVVGPGIRLVLEGLGEMVDFLVQAGDRVVVGHLLVVLAGPGRMVELQ